MVEEHGEQNQRDLNELELTIQKELKELARDFLQSDEERDVRIMNACSNIKAAIDKENEKISAHYLSLLKDSNRNQKNYWYNYYLGAMMGSMINGFMASNNGDFPSEARQSVNFHQARYLATKLSEDIKV